MLNGSYAYKIQTSIFELQYNSRSLFYGNFGFGWCSMLDVELELDANTIIYKECDNIVEFKKNKNNLFLSSQGTQMKFHKNQYFFKSRDKELIFSNTGKILEIKTTKNKYLFKYHLDRTLHEISTNDGLIRVEWDEKWISGLYSYKSIQNFNYDNGNLISWYKDTVKQESFSYDELNNLNQIVNNNVVESLKYDLNKDLVTEYKNKEGCIEKYDYKNLDEGIFQALGNISCSSGTFAEVRHTFYFLKNSLGRFDLTKTVSTINGESFERHFVKVQRGDAYENIKMDRSYSSSM